MTHLTGRLWKAARRARLPHILAAGLSANVLAVSAHAETFFNVDVAGGPKIASNPFLLEGDDTESVALSLEVDPRLIWQDETSRLQLSANIRLDQNSRRYGLDEAVAVRLSGSDRLDERTTVTGYAAFTTSRGSVRDALLNRRDPVDIENPVLPMPIDSTVAGLRSRVNALSALLNVQHLLSPRDVISIGTGISESRFQSFRQSNYRQASTDLSYGRRLSERTTINAGLRVAVSEYLNRRAGDGYSLTPLVGIERQLGQTLRLTARVGVFFARSDRGDGTKRSESGFAGEATLCDAGLNSTYCLSASRSAQPTAFGGITAVTGLGVNYDRRLNLRDRLQLSASYSSSNESNIPGTFGESSDFVGVSATASREISRRFEVFVRPSYAKAFNGGVRRDANYEAMIGLRYRLGRLQ